MITTLLGGVFSYLVAFLAVFLHEISHYAIARIAGARDMTVTLLPYGASLSLPDDVPHVGAILLAGPASNLLLAACSLALSWLVPEMYGYLRGFITANVHIAFVNLLPAYPLDGGRLLSRIAKGKWARVFSEGMTLALGVGAVFLFFRFGFTNLTLLTFGVFMTMYFFAFSLPFRKVCNGDSPLFSLVSSDKEGRIRAVRVKEKGRTLCLLSAKEVTDLVLKYDRDTPIREAIAREGKEKKRRREKRKGGRTRK